MLRFWIIMGTLAVVTGVLLTLAMRLSWRIPRLTIERYPELRDPEPRNGSVTALLNHVDKIERYGAADPEIRRLVRRQKWLYVGAGICGIPFFVYLWALIEHAVAR